MNKMKFTYGTWVCLTIVHKIRRYYRDFVYHYSAELDLHKNTMHIKIKLYELYL